MFILMISRGIPSAKDPQWGCFEQDQAEALQRYGHKVVVASVDSRFLKRWRKIGITHKHKDGVDYYNSFWVPGKITRKISKKFNLWVKEKQLDRIYKRIVAKHGKPDVIYGQFFFNTALGAFLKKKYALPLVGIEHAGRFNNDVLDVSTRFLSNIAYKNTDMTIAVSDNLRDRLFHYFGLDSVVVHNLVSSHFIGKTVKNDIHKKEFTFVTVGSLLYGKGFDVLINAFALVGLSEKNVSVVIVGEGEERMKLQKLIDDKGLSKCVRLVGRKTKNEVVEILCNSNCFVLPSRGENFSVAILEALTIGLPVISTDCGGARKCINERNGLVVPIDDVHALSEGILYMYNNIEKYNSEIIAKECDEHYSDRVIVKQLIEVFEKGILKYNMKQ